MHLDTRTIVILATFVAIVPTLISVAVWYTKRTCAGFGRWTLGTFLGTLALACLSFRGVAPDWISMVLANTLAVSAAILYFQGVRQFCGLRLYGWPEYLAGALTVSAVVYFRYFDNNIDFRTFAISLLLGSLGFWNGIALLGKAPVGRGFGTLFTGIVFILAGIAHLARGAYLVTFTPGTDLFAPSAVNASFFAAASLGFVCWSFGFILMLGDRQETKQGPLVPAPAGHLLTDTQVREQVQRIILSEGFRRSARMERFLTLAVERTLLGHPEELKEYAIGRDVFQRGDAYDPREDSIVRVEAQRLRRKLREYYESSGKNDPIIVEFHAGSYVPTFRHSTIAM